MANVMNCKECEGWLHAYLDNELETETALRVSQHLENCSICKEKLKTLQSLCDGLRANAQYYPAPELLQQRIRAQFQKQSAYGRWMLPTFSTAALAASVMLYLAVPSSTDTLINDVVSSHVRSLMEQHLTDVASSNQHTVKPWFTGKIDFSPPVVNLADKGYPLIGGRLDYIRHQNAAALAYRRNKHIINVFISPAFAADSGIRTTSMYGFNVVSWSRNAMAFEAVSDLNKDELVAFAQMLIQP